MLLLSNRLMAASKVLVMSMSVNALCHAYPQCINIDTCDSAHPSQHAAKIILFFADANGEEDATVVGLEQL
jgi:hypothetical protein